MPAKKAAKLDPKKLFVITAISRASIAESLNNAVEEAWEDGVDVEAFADDDPRLTDKVCQDFADDLYDGVSDTVMDENGMQEIELSREYVHKFASKKKKGKKRS